MWWKNFKVESDSDIDVENVSLLSETNLALNEYRQELHDNNQYFEYKNRSHNGEYFVFSYNAITWENIDDIKQKYVDQYWWNIDWILVTDGSGNEINDLELKNSMKIYVKAKISDNPNPIKFNPLFPTAEYNWYYINIERKWWTPSNLRQMFQDQNDLIIEKDAFSFVIVNANNQYNQIYSDSMEFQPLDKIVMNVKKASVKQNNNSALDNHLNVDSPEEIHEDESIKQTEVQNDVNRYVEDIEKQDGRIAYGNRNNKEISITIDDGNSEPATRQILEILSKRWIKATFFIIWSNIKNYPNLWKTVIEQWHQICCHTYSHIYLNGKTPYTSLWGKKQEWIWDVKRLLWNEYYKNLEKKCTSGDFPTKLDSDLLLETEILMWEQEVKINLGEDYLAKMKKNYPFFRFPWWCWFLGATQEVKTRNVEVLRKMWYLSIWWSTDFVENKRALTADEVASKSIPNGSIPLFHCKNSDVERINQYTKNANNREMTALPLSEILVLGKK